MDWKIGTALGLGLLLAAGIYEKMTGGLSALGSGISSLGGGIGTLGQGIQTGLSAMLSPQITPVFVPTVGFQLCLQPFTGPCTVSTRETGNVAGSGTGSRGFHKLFPFAQQQKWRKLIVM
jgi:hypothetical protein